MRRLVYESNGSMDRLHLFGLLIFIYLFNYFSHLPLFGLTCMQICQLILTRKNCRFWLLGQFWRMKLPKNKYQQGTPTFLGKKQWKAHLFQARRTRIRRRWRRRQTFTRLQNATTQYWTWRSSIMQWWWRLPTGPLVLECMNCNYGSSYVAA